MPEGVIDTASSSEWMKEQYAGRKPMPWSKKQMKAIRARAHGWKPSAGGPFEDVSEDKAREMMAEGVKGEGRKKAIKSMLHEKRKGG
jgi:hypothetical protein